jgi:predicted ATP-grasp superfamily ATP-dependent carboligase
LQYTKRIRVLLASASYGGTIAAVRSLAASGFDVGVILSSHGGLAAAAWSRHVSRRYLGPPESASSAFLERLLAIGAAEPGQVLVPTSDETAWLYTENAARLEAYFCVYQPSLTSMRRILDKQLFADAALRAGLTVLPSWQPNTLADVGELAPSLSYPILIKRRSHVHRLTNDKGIVVHSSQDLIRQYEQYVERERKHITGGALTSDLGLPFLQQFVTIAEEGVCSVTGFIDRSGELFVTRRSTKVFQRSQPVGIGVCFESLPPDPSLNEAVRALCGELGFFGIFEVEFLKFDGAWAVIDFNPRLFNQVGMDIRRGMPLPLLACLDAARESEQLRNAVGQAQTQGEELRAAFCDGFTLRAILAARMVTGRISRKEFAYWRSWVNRNAVRLVDVARDEHDSMPAVIHAMSEIYRGLKAIPKFLRLTPRASLSVAKSAMEASP